MITLISFSAERFRQFHFCFFSSFWIHIITNTLLLHNFTYANALQEAAQQGVFREYGHWIPKNPNHLSLIFFSNSYLVTLVETQNKKNSITIPGFEWMKPLFSLNCISWIPDMHKRLPRPDVNPFVPTVPTFAVRETASLGQQIVERWEQMG